MNETLKPLAKSARLMERYGWKVMIAFKRAFSRRLKVRRLDNIGRNHHTEANFLITIGLKAKRDLMG